MQVGDIVRYVADIMTDVKGHTGTILAPSKDRSWQVMFDNYDYTGKTYTQHTCMESSLELMISKAKAAARKPSLPLDSAERKRWPMFSGLLAYFPAALANVSNHSFIGNEKHNPGLALQHARGKSGDHEDCIVRHLVDAMEHPPGSPARIDELRALAWRALALLQEDCEVAGHSIAPAAVFKDKETNAST